MRWPWQKPEQENPGRALARMKNHAKQHQRQREKAVARQICQLRGIPVPDAIKD